MGFGPISNYAYTQIVWINGYPVPLVFYHPGNGPFHQGTEGPGQ